MPPLKPVRTLKDLALSATSDLVVSSCKNIQECYPSENGLHYDVDGCPEAVQKIQDLLKDALPVSLWEPLLQSIVDTVPEHNWMNDQRILYGAFIYNKVDLKKIRMLSIKMFQRYEPYVKFWTQRMPMLTRLLEIDVKFVPKVGLDAIVLAVGKSCTELRAITLPYRAIQLTENMESMFRSCTKLRRLKGSWSIQVMHRVMELLEDLEDVFVIKTPDPELLPTPPLDINPKLKMRALSLSYFTYQEVKTILDVCPNVQDLSMSYNSVPLQEYNDTFRYLAASELKLSKIQIRELDNHGDLTTFLSCKGINITDLLISGGYFREHPWKVLQAINKYCPNLRKLKLHSVNVSTLDDRSSKLSFPNLELLEIIYDCFQTSASITLLENCLEGAGNLTELCIHFLGDPDADNVLMQMFTTRENMKQIKKLHVTGVPMRHSQTLARFVFDHYPNLTRMEFSSIPKKLLHTLRKEAKLKNFDIEIPSFLYWWLKLFPSMY